MEDRGLRLGEGGGSVGRLTEREIEVLRAYAACGMRAARAAKRLYMSAPNVHHILRQIRERTRIDPKDVWGLTRLLKEAEENG